MGILVISGSLRSASRSRVLTRALMQSLETARAESRFLDLRDYPLPLCDGEDSYNHENVAKLDPIIQAAQIILLGVPIYNYDINAAVKNLVELTGESWEGKTLGFLCAAGGRSSYMSVMSFANSMMLDFRSIIIPRFVYAASGDFTENSDGQLAISNPKIQDRVQELAQEAQRFQTLYSS